jgi:hypothetical protein
VCIAIGVAVTITIWGSGIVVNSYNHTRLPVGAKEAVAALHKARLELTQITIDHDAKSLSIESTEAPSVPEDPVKFESITVDYSAMPDSDFDAMSHYIGIIKKSHHLRMNAIKYGFAGAVGAYILIALIRTIRRTYITVRRG